MASRVVKGGTEYLAHRARLVLPYAAAQSGLRDRTQAGFDRRCMTPMVAAPVASTRCSSCTDNLRSEAGEGAERGPTTVAQRAPAIRARRCAATARPAPLAPRERRAMSTTLAPGTHRCPHGLPAQPLRRRLCACHPTLLKSAQSHSSIYTIRSYPSLPQQEEHDRSLVDAAGY